MNAICLVQTVLNQGEKKNYFSVEQQYKTGLGCYLTLDVSTLHTHTPGWTALASDQLVAEAATYKTDNNHKTRTSMPSAGYKPVIQAIMRQQTYTLGRTATGIGKTNNTKSTCGRSRAFDCKVRQEYTAMVFREYAASLLATGIFL